MSKYISRENLSWIVQVMINRAIEKKSRQGVYSHKKNKTEYQTDWEADVTRSLEHYCDTAGIFVCVNPFDMKYTIGQLEVIKFILDRRRNCGNKIL